MVALEKANHVRLARKALRVAVEAGDASIAAALDARRIEGEIARIMRDGPSATSEGEPCG
jgi:hypothetical protein